MNGWIKLHRKLLNSEVFRNEKLLKVFVYCLLKATHIDYEQVVGKQTVTLNPGQFVFGRKKAAQELDINESTVRDYISLLKKHSIIDIKPTNKFSIITVVNWGFYQSEEENSDNKTDSKMTTECQQNDTNKNIKNIKNINTYSRNSKSYDEDSVYFQLALRLFNKIKENNPEHKEPNLQKWAGDFRLMIERDSRTEKQITYLIDWCQQDSFWKSNILSPQKLRKHFDRLIIAVKSKKQTKTSPQNISLSRPDHWKEPTLTAEELKQLEEIDNEAPY